MKGAAHRWIMTSFAGVALVMAGGAAPAAEVTDADRVFRNYTRETATVSEGQIRLEVRALKVQDEENTRLNTIGLPLIPVESLSAGVIDLVGSYGVAKNTEVGFVIPGIIETLRFKDNSSETNEDIGDLLLYTKFKHQVAERCWMGGGVELTLPNGPVHKGFGTGDVGVNPVVSTRYQRGPVALGAHAGYQLYDGKTDDVFNYSVEGIMRVSEAWAFRTEWSGRLFNHGGTRIWDAQFLPGIDLNFSNNLTLRPTALANATHESLDWGIGMGVAVTF